jgi:hypothetical protein
MRILRVVSVAFAAVSGPAIAQPPAPPPAQQHSSQTDETSRGTPEQRAACTADVFRLCAVHIPNVENIVGCLKEKKSSLSVACRVVFDGDRPQRSAQPRRAPAATEGSGGSSH